MDDRGIPELTRHSMRMVEALSGAQLAVLEMVMYIFIVTIVILIAATLGIIAWVCFREGRGLQRSRPLFQGVQDEKDQVSLLVHHDHGHACVRSWPRAVPSPYAAGPGRIFSRPGR